jgi:hypothetical protein
MSFDWTAVKSVSGTRHEVKGNRAFDAAMLTQKLDADIVAVTKAAERDVAPPASGNCFKWDSDNVDGFVRLPYGVDSLNLPAMGADGKPLKRILVEEEGELLDILTGLRDEVVAGTFNDELARMKGLAAQRLDTARKAKSKVAVAA